MMQDNLVELSDEECLVAIPDCLRAYGTLMKIRREIRDSQSDVLCADLSDNTSTYYEDLERGPLQLSAF